MLPGPETWVSGPSDARPLAVWPRQVPRRLWFARVQSGRGPLDDFSCFRPLCVDMISDPLGMGDDGKKEAGEVGVSFWRGSVTG